MANKVPALREVTLDDKYTLDQTEAYLTGIEALVRLPILQHQRDQQAGLNTAGFISGYRGSPLGTLDQSLWNAQKYLEKHNITFIPGINEDLAATAVRGSQEVGLQPGAKFDGVFGMWYGKGPGFDRSLDAFRHANAAGTAKYGGVLAVVGDDHGCKSSTYPYQSEHLFTSLSMPVLAPASVQEVLDLGIYGWELSRYCGCWVGLKAITENMDSAISAQIDPKRINIRLPKDFEMPKDGVNVRWPDSPMAQELRLNKYKIYAARAFALENDLNKIVIDTDKPRLGIITSGKSYLDVLQAFDDLGIDEASAAAIGIRVYKVGMPWPLEPVKTHEFASGLTEILVVEEKRSVIEDQLTGQLYNWPVEERPRVVGEYDEEGNDLLTNLGELTPAMIARAIASRIDTFHTSKTIEARIKFINRKERTLAKERKVSERKASFCSGCPHNTSTQVPEGSIAGGGIGCHYMSTWMTNRPAHNFTHMGGEGVTWTGMSAFTDTKHVFQNLGDGTYFHSGVLAIRQSVSSKVNITYKILMNGAVAMTGGQAVDGELTMPRLVAQLQGEGVKRIDIVSDQPKQFEHMRADGVDVWHRDDLLVVQDKLRKTEGTTVLIYEQACATAKRRARKRGLIPAADARVVINDAVCEGCGDCGKKSNCLSVIPKETELGRKRQIDQAACNQDFSCVKGFCPSFVTVSGGKLKKRASVDALEAFTNLPEPTKPELNQPWNILVTGVGGTGVLTVAAVLAMAGHLEFKGVATMNQTGLAQKFGPVVSHLRIANNQEEIHAVRIPAGDADVMIGCDLAVSASDDALAKLAKDRSHVVINDTLTATAEFIDNPDVVFHIDPMTDSIKGEVKASRAHFLPAGQMASALLGDSIATNLFMVGVAYQKGLIPLSQESIFKALELNGVSVQFNQQAFLWGRMTVVDRAQVEDAAQISTDQPERLQGLQEIIDYRYNDLQGYQNKAYADRYKSVVDTVKSKEAGIVSDGKLKLTLSVAKALHRLMAYKDEYEVARLYTDGRFDAKLKAQFEGPVKLNFHLAPPLLSKRNKHTGELQKMKFGGWIKPVFGVLARFKFLRGTAFDIFGYTGERKHERALIATFEATLDDILNQLNANNIDAAVKAVDGFNKIRGFGHVKEGNLKKAQTQLKIDLAQMNKPSVELKVEKPGASSNQVA